MLKRKIATIKARFSNIAETDSPGHAITKTKADREETAFLDKILTGVSRRPQGYRTYTNRVEFQRQMSIDIAAELDGVRNQKEGRPANWQNQEAFRIREAYKIKKWKELSLAEQKRWIEEAKKEANKDIESMTP
jgi:hypothetical protein